MDPFEKMWDAPIEEKPEAGGEEPIPAGQHLLNINWKQIAVKDWAKTPENPEGNVLSIGFGKPGHQMVFENFALDPKWAWKLRSLYDAAGLEWGQPIDGLMGQKIAAEVTVNDNGFRNVRKYKSLDAVAKNPPKSKAAPRTATQKVDAETAADLQDIPF